MPFFGIHVCTSCGGRAAVARSASLSAVDDLLAALAARVARDELPFRVVPQPCFGPCGRGVRLAVTGPGRWGWLFEGLRPGPDMDAFVQFLAAWQAAPNGLPAKADRAPLLRKIVGRVPPSDSPS